MPPAMVYAVTLWIQAVAEPCAGERQPGTSGARDGGGALAFRHAFVVQKLDI